MRYLETYHYLKTLLRKAPCRCLTADGLLLEWFPFVSENGDLLPDSNEYLGTEYYRHISDKMDRSRCSPQMLEILHLGDSQVRENIRFHYPVFAPPESRSGGIIVLFHGLNERNWEKYLPWAYRLVHATGKAVVLFPMAFHMNRAPQAWRDARPMRDLSEIRRQLFPSLSCSSFANAAISTRLQSLPQRFFWSGIQTYRDFLQFLRTIRQGDHPRIRGDASVDLFGYSIGAFLSQLLLMIEPVEALAESRLFMFCGGATFDRMFPASRYILDSEAVIALYGFFIQNLDEQFKCHQRLSRILGGTCPEGLYFRSMLDYYALREVRETRLRQIGSRIHAAALAGDKVLRPEEIVNTLQGFYRDIPVQVDVETFSYPCTHENPFPLLNGIATQVDRCFNRVFDSAACFLGSR